VGNDNVFLTKLKNIYDFFNIFNTQNADYVKCI